jgi:hypothetical protein
MDRMGLWHNLEKVLHNADQKEKEFWLNFHAMEGLYCVMGCKS